MESPPPEIMQFFKFDNLPSELQIISAPFCNLAWVIFHRVPNNSERDVTLRKLLEARDAAVRAVLFK